MTKGKEDLTPFSTKEGILTFHGPLKLTSDVPLKIELIEKKPQELDRPSLKLCIAVFFILAILLVTLMLFSSKYVLSRSLLPSTNCAPEIPELAIALSHPSYVAVGDESYIDATVINQSNKAITGSAVVVFIGLPSVQIIPSTHNVISFTAMKGGEQETTRVRFTVNESRLLNDGTVTFYIQVTTDDMHVKTLESRTIALTSIAYLNTILRGLWGLILTVWGGFLREIIKRGLGTM